MSILLWVSLISVSYILDNYNAKFFGNWDGNDMLIKKFKPKSFNLNHIGIIVTLPTPLG